MSTIYNVYCDESCHLENDGQKIMVLGAVWCPLEQVRKISEEIREIKIKHQLSPKFEIKWTKVSPAKQAFYDLLSPNTPHQHAKSTRQNHPHNLTSTSR
jgi:hypothetical protein